MHMLLPLNFVYFIGHSLLSSGPENSQIYLKAGDRVVFYGDSITDQRLYTTFTETYVVTRFPKMNVTFVHSGWGGDSVTGGGAAPLIRGSNGTFSPTSPTVMTIMLGMNDACYKAFDQEVFEIYTQRVPTHHRFLETKFA